MRIFPIVFVLVVNTRLVLLYRKCCDRDTYLEKTNFSYTCVKDEEKRLQIFTQEIDVLKQTGTTNDDTCVDVSGVTIVEYRIRDHKIDAKTPIDVYFYTKCCPLNFYYDSVSHSCVWKDNMDHTFIKQNFIKVGLPQCRVIVDYRLGSEKMDYYINRHTLYIENSTIFPDGKYCLDRDENDLLIARGCYDDLDICSKIKCIHKCCPDGQSYVNGAKCKNTYQYGLNLNFTTAVNNPKDPFAIIHGQSCRIYVLNQKRKSFYLDSDGVFWLHFVRSAFVPFSVEEDSYCIEHAYKNTPRSKYNNFEFFMCIYW